MSELAQQSYLDQPQTQPQSQPPSFSQPEPPQTVNRFGGDKCQEVYRVANALFHQDPDWVTFFREILGVDGVVRRLFVSQEELAGFEKTNEYAELQQMLTKLRQRNAATPDDKEPTRVITVRLPKSLHESLRVEAHDRKTSMNKLCISKLLQVIDDQFVPTE